LGQLVSRILSTRFWIVLHRRNLPELLQPENDGTQRLHRFPFLRTLTKVKDARGIGDIVVAGVVTSGEDIADAAASCPAL